MTLFCKKSNEIWIAIPSAKVETIKESYFPKVQSANNDDTAAPLETENDLDVSDTMAAYMTAIRRSKPFGMGSTASGHETQ